MPNAAKPPTIEKMTQGNTQGASQGAAPGASLDDKLKNILSKDLNVNDSDMETSISYSQEKDKNNYQEIFSNSATGPNAPPAPKNESLDKKKFFNKYMQF
jgi:hypothetical protein